ncbi:MAG TPA: LCP family protein [Galbitalea sp.]|nr:LCP family protein [Galbitalea sp.]
MVTRPTPPAPRRPLITDLDQSGRRPARKPSDRGPGKPPSKRGPKDASRSRVIRRRVIAIVVVAVLVLVGYVAFNYESFVGGITHVNAIPGGTSDDRNENILLVGDDHRPAGATAQQLAELGTTQDGGSLDTDTIMILHVPANGANPTLISIPRDSWVNVPGAGMRKINAAFAIGAAKGGDSGGAQLLIQVVQNLTGLTIDHYVRISLLGFYNVVNALGPVPVCILHAVDDPYSGLRLPAGYTTLDASQALAFVRQRHGLPAGDLDRVIRQQYFLSIEARQILNAGTLLNPVKLHNVITAVSSSIQTDPDLNMLNLAAQVKSFGGNLHSATIPITGTPTIDVNGIPVSIVQVNTAAMPAFIASITNLKTSTGTPVKPSKITLTVLNGSGVNGAAGAATTALSKLGFHLGTPQTASIQPKTTVNYPAADAAAAKVVAGYFPGAVLVASTSVSQVQVVLGSDHIAVNAEAGAAASSPTPTSTKAPTSTYDSKSCVD